jgi:hypothetical protein
MKKKISRISVTLLGVLLLCGGMPAMAATITHNISGGSLTIDGTSTDNYVITGSSTANRVTVNSGYQGTITLDNVNILSSSNAPISIAGQYNCSNTAPVTKVKVILKGDNKLESKATNYPAFQVDQGAQIHISAIDPTDDASGRLTATASSTSSAGIGAGYNTTNHSMSVNPKAGGNQGVATIYRADGGVLTTSGVTAGGNIIISGGNVTAIGGHGAGIGGAFRNYYNGLIIIYGGNVVSAGGNHSAGIGTGCPNGTGNDGTTAENSAIIVIPPASIKATTLQSGKPGLAGAASITYVGDPQSHLVTVKTEDNAKNADIYADLSETASVTNLFSTLSIPHDLTKVKFGNTGSSGQLQFRATFAQNVTFFTDAASSVPATSGRPYTPVKTTVTSPTTVVLPLLAINISLKALPSVPMEPGYTAAQALANAHRVKITYSDAKPMTGVSFGLQGGGATHFAGLKFYAADGSTEITPPAELTNGMVFYVAVPLKDGKPIHIYSDVFRFSGTWDGKATGYIRQIVSQLVASNDTETNANIKVTASPASFATNNAAAANATLSLNITHSGLSIPYDAANATARYLVTTQPNYDLAVAATPLASWTSLNIPASDGAAQTTVVPYSNKPDGAYYIHWHAVSGTVFAHSRNAVNPAALYGSFGPYIIDTSDPVATLKVDGNTAKDISGLAGLPVTIEFNEAIKNPGTSLTAAAFEISPAGAASIGTIAVVSGSGDKNFTATLTPANSLYNGQSFTVKLKAGAVTDPAGNANTQSNTVTVTLKSTVAPGVAFKNAAIYSSLKPSFTMEITPGDFTINGNTDLSLTAGGANLNVGANLNSLFVIKPEKGSPLTSGYTAMYGKTGSGATAKGIVTITFTADLQNVKKYVVSLAANKFYNKLRNGNVADSAAFTIAQPGFTSPSTGISASPNLFENNGGSTVLTIQGEGLKLNAEKGLLSLRVACPAINYNSGAITGGFVTQTGVDVASLVNVPVPANTGASTQNHIFELYMTFNGKPEASTGKTCLVQVEPEASRIVNVVNTAVSVGDLTFGYTSAIAQQPANRQEITVTNHGARALNDLTIRFTGPDGASFTHTAPAPHTALAPGNTATFHVYLQTGKNAGVYAGGSAGSETKVSVSATVDGTSTTVTGNAVLIRQKVNHRASIPSANEGSVTGNPAPGTAWRNSATLQLTAAAAGAGDSVKDWKYAVVSTNSAPGEFDPAWTGTSGTTATYTFPAGTDGERYVFWKMNTNNIFGIKGQVEAGGVKVYRIDRVAPTVTSIVAERNTTNATSFKMTVNFSEPVGTVNASRFIATNATAGTPAPTGTPVNGGYTSYEIVITPNAGLVNGNLITFAVQAGAVKDRAGNENTASSALQNPSVTFNNVNPLVTLSTPDPTVNRPFVVTATFNKPVTGLTEKSFKIINGSVKAGSLSGSGTAYTVTVNTSASASGQIFVIVPDGAVTDAANNGNVEGELSVDYRNPNDRIAAVLSYSGPDYEKGAFEVNVSFTRNVTGLTAGDFDCNTADLDIPVLSGSGKNYTLTFTPKTDRDAATDIRLKAGIAARDEYGNELNGSNTVTVKYDTRRPLVSGIISPAGTIHYDPFTVTVVFDETAIGSFDPDRLILSNLAFLSVKSGPVTNGTNTEYEIILKILPDVASGSTVSLVVGEGVVRDKAGNPNVAGRKNSNTSLQVKFIDDVLPEVINISPSGTQVPIYGDFTVTFSEPMATDAGTIAINDGIGKLTGGKWINNRTYVVHYGALGYDNTYTATISGFRDLAGNVMLPVRHSFATVQANFPVIMRQITLHAGRGLKVDPETKTHYIRSQQNFVITVTALPGYSLSRLRVTTGVPLRDREGIRTTPNADGSVTVTILRVTEPLTVTLELDPEGANEITESGSRVWSYGRTLYAVSDKPAILRIFSLAGQFVRQETVGKGQTEIRLPQGIYTVTLGERTCRIIIR